MVMGTWRLYVLRFVGTERGAQTNAAALTGVPQGTISRWIAGGETDDAARVAMFARGFGRNVLEAFVAAELIELSDAEKVLGDEEYAVLRDVGIRVPGKPPRRRREDTA